MGKADDSIVVKMNKTILVNGIRRKKDYFSKGRIILEDSQRLPLDI